MRGLSHRVMSSGKSLRSEQVGQDASLTARIQISDYYVEHLPRSPRVALGYCARRSALAIGIGILAIRSRNRRQPRATAANQPHSLGDGKPRLKWPIANLPRWCASG